LIAKKSLERNSRLIYLLVLSLFDDKSCAFKTNKLQQLRFFLLCFIYLFFQLFDFDILFYETITHIVLV